MTIGQEIYDKLVEVFPGAIKDVTALSHNNAGGRDFICSSELGFDYDQVSNCSPAYPSSHKEKSPDALFCVAGGLYFVEFKEGAHNKADIRLKIHEGIVTLYMFVRKYLAHISKEDFLNLEINYAVLVRAEAAGSSFQLALSQASHKYQLRNLEGFLIKRTHYTMCPTTIAKLLNKLTLGKVGFIDIHQRSGGVIRVNV